MDLAQNSDRFQTSRGKKCANEMYQSQSFSFCNVIDFNLIAKVFLAISCPPIFWACEWLLRICVLHQHCVIAHEYDVRRKVDASMWGWERSWGYVENKSKVAGGRIDINENGLDKRVGGYVKCTEQATRLPGHHHLIVRSMIIVLAIIWYNIWNAMAQHVCMYAGSIGSLPHIWHMHVKVHLGQFTPASWHKTMVFDVKFDSRFDSTEIDVT